MKYKVRKEFTLMELKLSNTKDRKDIKQMIRDTKSKHNSNIYQWIFLRRLPRQPKVRVNRQRKMN